MAKPNYHRGSKVALIAAVLDACPYAREVEIQENCESYWIGVDVTLPWWCLFASADRLWDLHQAIQGEMLLEVAVGVAVLSPRFYVRVWRWKVRL